MLPRRLSSPPTTHTRTNQLLSIHPALSDATSSKSGAALSINQMSIKPPATADTRERAPPALSSRRRKQSPRTLLESGVVFILAHMCLNVFTRLKPHPPRMAAAAALDNAHRRPAPPSRQFLCFASHSAVVVFSTRPLVVHPPAPTYRCALSAKSSHTRLVTPCVCKHVHMGVQQVLPPVQAAVVANDPPAYRCSLRKGVTKKGCALS